MALITILWEGAFQNFAPYPLQIGEGRVRQLENEILKHTPLGTKKCMALITILWELKNAWH
jgi:hypothetical protein